MTPEQLAMLTQQECETLRQSIQYLDMADQHISTHVSCHATRIVLLTTIADLRIENERLKDALQGSLAEVASLKDPIVKRVKPPTEWVVI